MNKQMAMTKYMALHERNFSSAKILSCLNGNLPWNVNGTYCSYKQYPLLRLNGLFCYERFCTNH